MVHYSSCFRASVSFRRRANVNGKFYVPVYHTTLQSQPSLLHPSQRAQMRFLHCLRKINCCGLQGTVCVSHHKRQLQLCCIIGAHILSATLFVKGTQEGKNKAANYRGHFQLQGITLLRPSDFLHYFCRRSRFRRQHFVPGCFRAS